MRALGAVSSPSGVGAEPQPQTYLTHSQLSKRTSWQHFQSFMCNTNDCAKCFYTKVIFHLLKIFGARALWARCHCKDIVIETVPVFQGPGHGLSGKDQYLTVKDKDLNRTLKKSLRTRTKVSRGLLSDKSMSFLISQHEDRQEGIV